jgi:hypothetical protein
MPSLYRININKSIKQSNLKLNIIDIKNLCNFNIKESKLCAKKEFNYLTIFYTDILPYKFIQEVISINIKYNFDNLLNMNMLFNNSYTNSVLRYRSGFTALLEFNIPNTTYNENVLNNNIHIETIFITYKYIYNLKIDNSKFFYNHRNIHIQRNKEFDYIITNYFQAPNSKSDVINSIFFYRNFPIFNYILYLNRKYYQTDIDENFDFKFDDNVNISDLTCLNYLIKSDINVYISNINKLINNINNILEYNIYYYDNDICDDFMNILYNRLLNYDPDTENIDNIVNNNKYENTMDKIQNYYFYIIIKELRINFELHNTDIYFNINKLLNLPEVTQISFQDTHIYIGEGLDKRIKTRLNSGKLIIDKNDLNNLLIRGLLRIYIEMVHVLMILNYNKINRIDPAINENNREISDDTCNYELIYSINNIKLDKINEIYKNISSDNINLYMSELLFSIYNTNLLKNMFNIDTNNLKIIDILKPYSNMGDMLEYFLELSYMIPIQLIDKFINTLTFINTIKNSKNYPLFMFLLMSNPDIKILINNSNNSLLKSLENMYDTRYIGYINL